MPRKRSAKKKNMYFTQVHEDAIVRYCSTDDMKTKEKLYGSLIQPAFSQMVDKIVFTYRFTTLPYIDDLREECKGWLVTILAKFDPNKGHKAFSYFSVVTKNWFTHKAKKQTQRNKREINYDDLVKEIEVVSASEKKSFEDKQEDAEFWLHLLTEIKSWDRPNLRDNEKCVLNAVLTLMESIDQIEIFNKKAIYLYLREITGLNTKQIVSSLNKMREKYGTFKKKWDNGEI